MKGSFPNGVEAGRMLFSLVITTTAGVTFSAILVNVVVVSGTPGSEDRVLIPVGVALNGAATTEDPGATSPPS
jgi:hypothetical protein